MKKLLALMMAILMCAALFAGCGGGSGNGNNNDPAPPAENQGGTAEVKGEMYDAGNVSALVPEGWKAIPVADMWAEDADAMDPNQLQIIKGGKNEFDILTKPYIQIVYYGPETSMMTPSSEWYDNAEDLEPVKIGDYTWNGFKATSFELPLILLWTGDSDGDQYQLTLWNKTEADSFNLEDADVQAIIASVKPSA